MQQKKSHRARPVDQLNTLLKQRPTTAPDMTYGGGGGDRTGAGPPSEGLEKFRQALQAVGAMGLFLITYLINGQQYADATGWWDGAADYIERVSTLMRDMNRLLPAQAAAFKTLPFTADDLLTRLVRVKLLAVVSEMLGGLVTSVKNTLLVEQADLMRMADVIMTEVEMTLGRPTLEPTSRATLNEMATLPMNIWHKWLDRLQQTQKNNEQLKSDRQAEIDAAQKSAQAAEALAKIVSGQQVSQDDALLAAGTKEQASRTGAANKRSNKRPKSSPQ